MDRSCAAIQCRKEEEMQRLRAELQRYRERMLPTVKIEEEERD